MSDVCFPNKTELIYCGNGYLFTGNNEVEEYLNSNAQ